MTLLEDEFLAKTNGIMEQVLGSSQANGGHAEQSLHAIARHLCISGHAKRARPLLCLYFHWLFDEDVENEFLKVAVAAEFIHAASLLHDDVVDEASTRRGKASANAVFGNAQAVLAGDFLLTEAFELLKPLGRELTDQAIMVVKEMTKAALLEINARGRMDLTEASWNAMARGKTGVLFSWCGFATAICAKNNHDKQRLWELGEHIGHIFQMADDLKDFSGDQNLKDICQDIRNKEPSLPIILAAQANPSIMDAFTERFLKERMSDDDVNFLRELIFDSGAIKETQARIKCLENKVRILIAPYDGTLGKARLEQWVQTIYDGDR